MKMEIPKKISVRILKNTILNLPSELALKFVESGLAEIEENKVRDILDEIKDTTKEVKRNG